MARIARRYLSIPSSELGVERLFSRGRDLLQYALHLTMKMLTILKTSYSDEVFRKALAEVSDEAIEDDIEVIIQEPKISMKSHLPVSFEILEFEYDAT